MPRFFSIATVLIIVVIICASVGYQLGNRVDQRGRAGRIDEVFEVPHIVMDSIKDGAEWSSKPTLPSQREEKNAEIEFRSGDDMKVVIELFNSRDGAITVDGRQRGGWHASLYRDGRVLDKMTVFMAEPTGKDLVAIESGDSAEFPLSLGSATTDPIAPGHYQLLISFSILQSETFGQSPRQLQKVVDVIVKQNRDLR